MFSLENSHEYYMQQALDQASIAMKKGEVPVGAVVVCDNRIISRAHNMVEMLNDSTAHAEMLAMSSAFEQFNSKYLRDCTLYVTLEPCCMCAGAAYWSQIGNIVYGASDLQKGGCTLYSNILHPRTIVLSGILSIQCEDILNNFFKTLRESPLN